MNTVTFFTGLSPLLFWLSYGSPTFQGIAVEKKWTKH